MKNPFPHLVVEMAKDGNPTLKHFKNGYWHYVYSKYAPKTSLNFEVQKQENPFLILSFGLGYEIEKILEETNSDIYVLEKENMWVAFLRGLSQTQPLLLNKRVHILQSKNDLPQNIIFNVIVGNHALYNLEFYGSFLYKRPKSNIKKCILFPDTPFLQECSLSFRSEGYTSLV